MLLSARLPEPFSRSLRSLAIDGSRRAMWMVVVIFVLGAWAAWFFGVPVTLYEVSGEARLEVARAGHPVSAQVDGRVISSSLTLGRRVIAGDVLVELDAETENRRLSEERSRLAAFEPQLEALSREIVAENESLRFARETGRAAIEGARARQTEAEADARYAEEEARRLTKAQKWMAELEVLRAQAEGKKKRAASEALGSEVRRLQRDQGGVESQRRARLEQLQRNRALLEGQIATSKETIAVLGQDIEKHVVRAPAAGAIGEAATLPPGAFVRAGESIATIVPEGQLKVVAEFPPQAALGRIRSGQPARLRLDGFPWLEYGTIATKVESVAAEMRSGRVRVELEVLPDPNSPIPLQHGLPGTVEIEIERVLPVTLVLRTVGKLAASARPSPSPKGAPDVSRSEAQ
jgi:multidrug resistance efflux pump